MVTPAHRGPRQWACALAAGRARVRSRALRSYPLADMAEYRYEPSEIEPRWQKLWAEERTWEVANDADDPRPKSYVLVMLPYPSGEPHIGHLKVYSVGDAVAHFHRRTGRRVLQPMGYDAFGLPAENHAIRTGGPSATSSPQPARAAAASAAAPIPTIPLTGGESRTPGRPR